MKFGKEFLCQMVPEWQGAYVDYNKLKGILKEILYLKREIRKQPTEAQATTGGGGGLKRRMTMYRAFSGLTRMHSGGKGKQQQRSDDDGDSELQAILVNININADAVEMEGGGSGDGRRSYACPPPSSSSFETMFLMSTEEEGGECYEVEFFKRLDEELTKVNEFYKAKVKEAVEEAHSLNMQMDALIAFRLKVENPNYHDHRHRPRTPPITTSPSPTARGNIVNNGN